MLKVITLRVTPEVLAAMDELVRMGRYPSRNELVRVAIRDLINSELRPEPALRRLGR